MKMTKRNLNIVSRHLAKALNRSIIAFYKMGGVKRSYNKRFRGIAKDLSKKLLCQPETRVLPRINKSALFRILPVLMHNWTTDKILNNNAFIVYINFVLQHDIIKNDNINKTDMEVLNDYC